MESAKEKVSYCIGLETARNLKEQFTDLDVERLNEGFNDALNGENPKLGQEEIRGLMLNLRRQMESQQKAYIAKMAEQNKKSGEQFLEKNRQKEGIQVLPSGLQYQVLHQGSGEKVTIFDTVQVHYRGSFVDGNVFESTYERNQPLTIPVNRTIQGWSEALKLMRMGDKWKIFIPSYLAYGEMGYGNAIGPNTALVFEMELLKINP